MADRAADALLMAGMERWEKEGRLGPAQATEMRKHLSSWQVQDSMHHLGVHILLSAPIPIPGLQNLARLAWTVAFSVVVQVKRLRHRAAGSREKFTNVHTPLVMVLSLLPVLGSFAYLATRPLWNMMLWRLVLDQVAWKLPFGLYKRMRLERLLPPSSKGPVSPDAGGACVGDSMP